MKYDMHYMVGLFHKSFTGELSDDEKRIFGEVMQDPALRTVYEQLGDENYLTTKFRELDNYDHLPAFGKLKALRRKRLLRRASIWASSAAAAIAAALLLLPAGPGDIVAESERFINPGRSAALLRLPDGREISIADNSVEIEASGSGTIIYQEGRLVYSAGTAAEEYIHELVVPVGGECFVQLDDRTGVWVNAATRLRYPAAFTGGERRVELEGEAYFEVTPDTRPFVVSTGLGEVTVLGTSFGVTAYPGETGYATLVEGSVHVTAGGRGAVTLLPGQQAVIPHSGKLDIRDVDVEEYVSWKDGLFVFRDKPLLEIMAILGRWYGVNTNFHEDGLGQLRYTGNLKRYESINTFLELLERLNEVHYRVEGNNILLYR